MDGQMISRRVSPEDGGRQLSRRKMGLPENVSTTTLRFSLSQENQRGKVPLSQVPKEEKGFPPLLLPVPLRTLSNLLPSIKKNERSFLLTEIQRDNLYTNQPPEHLDREPEDHVSSLDLCLPFHVSPGRDPVGGVVTNYTIPTDSHSASPRTTTSRESKLRGRPRG